jgi:hypothetical protein
MRDVVVGKELMARLEECGLDMRKTVAMVLRHHDGRRGAADCVAWITHSELATRKGHVVEIVMETRQPDPNLAPLLTVVALPTEWHALTGQPPPTRGEETSP